MPFISLQDQGFNQPAQTLRDTAEFVQRSWLARQNEQRAGQAEQRAQQQFAVEQQKRQAEALEEQARQQAIAQDIATRQAQEEALRRQRVADAQRSEGTVGPDIAKAGYDSQLSSVNVDTARKLAPEHILTAKIGTAEADAKAKAAQLAVMPHKDVITKITASPNNPGLSLFHHVTTVTDPETGKDVPVKEYDDLGDSKTVPPESDIVKDFLDRPVGTFDKRTGVFKRLDPTGGTLGGTAAPLKFSTVEEAQKAAAAGQLKIGQRVIINGVPGTWK